MNSIFKQFRQRWRPSRRQAKRLRFEPVEERTLMSASARKLVSDPVVTLAQADSQDGSLSRADMLGLFAEVESGGKISATELKDLRGICNSQGGFNISADVRDLASDVVNANPANKHYQGHALGNLKVGDSSSKLEKLVDKWFYGDDLPAIDKFSYYQSVDGTLFAGAPSYSDIYQGASGDCYLLSAFAELTVKDPAAIENMFIDNGDGTFAVRFYQRGVAQYVTVNQQLPVYDYNRAEYARFGTEMGGSPTVLWVALAEKAYCQINEEGWTGHGSKNSYKAISSGNPADVIHQITADETGFTPITSRSSSAMLNTIVDDFETGEAITLATKNHGTAANIVHDHSYAMIDYDAATQQVTLFNPWGLDNGSGFPGLVTLSWTAITQSFVEWEVGLV